jgi:ligand-binding SRPBCC domain-containing protein
MNQPNVVTIQRACGGGFKLQTEFWVPQPPAEVFPFFADAGNLNRLTPPWLRFRIETPMPLDIRAGVHIDYRLRIHGFPVRWRSEISAWDPPERFVDEQRRGPYRYWIHEHTFISRDGGTVVGDRVAYALPLGGIWGRLVHSLIVGRDLTKIFAHRRRRMLELFGPT